jgi:hypothetical protein
MLRARDAFILATAFLLSPSASQAGDWHVRNYGYGPPMTTHNRGLAYQDNPYYRPPIVRFFTSPLPAPRPVCAEANPIDALRASMNDRH